MSYFSDNFSFGPTADGMLTAVTDYWTTINQHGMFTFILAILFGLAATAALWAILSSTSMPDAE